MLSVLLGTNMSYIPIGTIKSFSHLWVLPVGCFFLSGATAIIIELCLWVQFLANCFSFANLAFTTSFPDSSSKEGRDCQADWWCFESQTPVSWKACLSRNGKNTSWRDWGSSSESLVSCTLEVFKWFYPDRHGFSFSFLCRSCFYNYDDTLFLQHVIIHTMIRK